jgi:hypothetical protein
MPTVLLLLLVLAVPSSTIASSSPPVTAFALGDVRILDGPFREAQQRDIAYLLRLEPDRLLHTFRLNAGLPTSAKPYGGWEAPDVELRGHSLGHYLTACALMYEATGDERLRARALSFVGGCGRCSRRSPRGACTPGISPPFPKSSSTGSRRAGASGRPTTRSTRSWLASSTSAGPRATGPPSRP